MMSGRAASAARKVSRRAAPVDKSLSSVGGADIARRRRGASESVWCQFETQVCCARLATVDTAIFEQSANSQTNKDFRDSTLDETASTEGIP